MHPDTWMHRDGRQKFPTNNFVRTFIASAIGFKLVWLLFVAIVDAYG